MGARYASGGGGGHKLCLFKNDPSFIAYGRWHMYETPNAILYHCTVVPGSRRVTIHVLRLCLLGRTRAARCVHTHNIYVYIKQVHILYAYNALRQLRR